MFSRFRFGRKKTEVQDQAMGPLQLATHFGATPRRGHMLPGRDGTVGILPATAQGVATGSCNRPASGPIAPAGRVVVGLQPPRHLLPVCVRPPVRTQNVAAKSRPVFSVINSSASHQWREAPISAATESASACSLTLSH